MQAQKFGKHGVRKERLVGASSMYECTFFTWGLALGWIDKKKTLHTEISRAQVWSSYHENTPGVLAHLAGFHFGFLTNVEKIFLGSHGGGLTPN